MAEHPPEIPGESRPPDAELAAIVFLRLIEDVCESVANIPDDLRERLDAAILTRGNLPPEEGHALLVETCDRLDVPDDVDLRASAVVAVLERLAS